MLRDDDLASTEEEEGALYIVDCTKDYGNTFFVKEGDDWGWLGYFIGRNKQISNVHLFYRGIARTVPPKLAYTPPPNLSLGYKFLYPPP
eukprot:scaffold10762_cov110-Skeletonema_marinoi.AAC.1